MSRLRIPALLNHSSGSKANARIIPLAFLTLIKLFPFLAALIGDRIGQAEDEAGEHSGTVVRSFLSPQNQQKRARNAQPRLFKPSNAPNPPSTDRSSSQRPRR